MCKVRGKFMMGKTSKVRKIAFVLAGGVGSRLWPVSRKKYPKQFIEFFSPTSSKHLRESPFLQKNFSLFQLTLLRLLRFFRSEDIYIIASDNYKFIIFNQLDNLSYSKDRILSNLSDIQKKNFKRNFLAEPCPRGSLGAVVLGLKFLSSTYPTSTKKVFYLFPSDHYIYPQSLFESSLKEAERIIQKGFIATFGIKPQSPKEDYGYILHKQGVITNFIEKPKKEKARSLIKKGAFWNSGIFAFQESLFLEELKKYQPRVYKLYLLKWQDFIKNFSKLPNTTLDYAIMEKTQKGAVVPFKPNWYDLGTWDSFLDTSSKMRGSLRGANNIFLNAEQCISYTCKEADRHGKNKLVTFIDTRDIIAVDTPDALVIMKRGSSYKVKELLNKIKKKREDILTEGLTVYRPWGYYTILAENKNYKVKEIGIYPQRAISLQRHRYRSEHWNVVEGEIEVMLGEKKFKAKRNQTLYVEKMKKHKVYNYGKKIAKIIEVQIGSLLSEEDIERFDKYEIT